MCRVFAWWLGYGVCATTATGCLCVVRVCTLCA